MRIVRVDVVLLGLQEAHVALEFVVDELLDLQELIEEEQVRARLLIYLILLVSERRTLQ